ncbi:MAG: ATP-binding protein [Gallionellaceae bacterium]
MIDPEIGFTSDAIKDPVRFVGRTELIRRCVQGLNSPVSLLAIYGKRGVGKSSLLRQIQQLALGDYTLVKRAGLTHEIPQKPRTFLTVYYSCDSLITSGESLLSRLCNDQDAEDGLLRLVPDDGKELTEFTRTKEVSGGADLKLINWGAKGIESSKYARTVPNDIAQTFRNYVSAIISHQVKKRMGRDGLLILLDEFDVIQDKHGLGSVIKSLTNAEVKFGICGIGQDLNDLVADHASVERLLEQGAIHVKPMASPEARQILDRAEELFQGALTFDEPAKDKICEVAQGYPYFVQMLGRACVSKANQAQTNKISLEVLTMVLDDIKEGIAFPTLESAYQRAIGESDDRKMLLHILADQPEGAAQIEGDVGRVFLKDARKDANDLKVEFVDQLLPRLLDKKFGPVLRSVPEGRGIYEFVNPVFRLYVRLRNM